MPFFRLSTFALLFCTPVAAAQEVVNGTPDLPVVLQEPVSESPQLILDLEEPLAGSPLAVPEGFASITDPAAATALLLKIAHAQFQSQQAKLVTGIELKLKLKDRQDGNASEVDFALAYMNESSEVIEISIDDLDRGTKVKKGFDGRDYWLEDGEKDRLVLSGHEFGKDRESIDEAMDLCSDLMLMLDFRQLEKRNMPRAVLVHEDGRRILVGDLKRYGGDKWRYHLWLGIENLQPHRLELAREVEVVIQDNEIDSIDEGADVSDDGSGASNGEVAEEATEQLSGQAEEMDVAVVIEYQRFELAGYKSFEGRFVPQLVEMHGAPYLQDEENYPTRILQIHRFQWMLEK
ncbi:MAG: hypothetical protein GY747_11190 [Planctomycetes bacterium]|nr:hypothetical protein [Planctomycetota bacterium]MCP4772195.1 hypothetical protein [Planctomycetota bacterium]MCP4861251.1 hypothetical protein [Planctomycetota bacterium]